jgi:hypothetical protein
VPGPLPGAPSQKAPLKRLTSSAGPGLSPQLPPTTSYTWLLRMPLRGHWATSRSPHAFLCPQPQLCPHCPCVYHWAMHLCNHMGSRDSGLVCLFSPGASTLGETGAHCSLPPPLCGCQEALVTQSFHPTPPVGSVSLSQPASDWKYSGGKIASILNIYR